MLAAAAIEMPAWEGKVWLRPAPARFPPLRLAEAAVAAEARVHPPPEAVWTFWHARARTQTRPTRWSLLPWVASATLPEAEEEDFGWLTAPQWARKRTWAGVPRTRTA